MVSRIRKLESFKAGEKVNGYDENFRGWGNKDGDLRERLKMIGVRPKPIFEEALVFPCFIRAIQRRRSGRTGHIHDDPTFRRDV